MGEFGIDKIILIMLVVLLLFGAKRIPEIGSSLGKGIRDFKRSMNELHNDVRSDIAPPPPDAPVRRSEPAPSGAEEGQVRAEPKRLLG